MKTGYDNIDEAYRDLYREMASYASRHLFNSDFRFDAVNDAFSKVVIYIAKQPSAKVSSFILFKELKRSIRRINKNNSQEISFGTLDQPINQHEENYEN